LFVLVLAGTLTAQVRTGNIYGKVLDTDGNPLPGVTVTLSGVLTAPMTSITSSEGVYRFVSLPASKDYAVKAELQGFKTEIRDNIIVVVGSNAEINITMVMGALEEEITVTAVTPVVDTKSTSVGVNVTQEVLQSLPTARDPWVILQMAPSILVDRENVGGAESGQQSNYIARGAPGYGNGVWAMDGMVITDPSAIGASPSYYDFDAFEEMNVTVGGADVTVQTGGVALNMVTRRGGNKVSLGGRFYLTDGKLQASNMTDELRAEGLDDTNKIRENKDYGFNLGLPLLRDKAWFWMSWGVQDIKTSTIYLTPDDTLLQNLAVKLNLQIIPQNRFEAFTHIGRKNKYGRSASSSLPDGYYQGGRYYMGSPIVKLQDEHMFGDNLFISIKYGWSDAGFNLTPMMDLEFDDFPVWDVQNQIWSGSEWRYYVERPVTQYNFLANYFNDSLFGASHDIKLGVEYADRNQYSESVYSGNGLIRTNYDTPTADINGDGYPDLVPGMQRVEYWRGNYTDANISALAAFFSDTIAFGQFNLILGLRYDQQAPATNPIAVAAVYDGPAWKSVADAATIQKFMQLLPAVEVPGIEGTDLNGDKYYWKVFSPRIGLTWDVQGNGKTIAKLVLAQYGDFMGTGESNRWRPGGVGGWMDFWWRDSGDGIVNLNELYWYHPSNYQLYRTFDDAGNFTGDWNEAASWFWGSFDYQNPGNMTDPYQRIDSEAGSSRTSEAMITLEREIFADFGLQFNLTYRRYDNERWTLKYFPDTNLIQNQSWYISAGTPPANVPGTDAPGSTGEASQHEWYYTSAEGTAYSPYTWVQKRPDFYRDFWGVDLVFNKRLSNKWMLNGSFTWQKQEAHYGDKGYLDPTNMWAFEGKPYAIYMGSASGKISQYIYSRWMFKVGGLYQLPYDINVSLNFMAREGWTLRERFQYIDYALPNPQSRSAWLYMYPFGSYRLPTFYNLTVRLEKMLRIGDTGRIYLMADVFNALNASVINRRYQRDWGNYYNYPDQSLNYWRPNTTFFDANEILNPLVVRLGIRFTF
jgi:hypothetical protein